MGRVAGHVCACPVGMAGRFSLHWYREPGCQGMGEFYFPDRKEI